MQAYEGVCIARSGGGLNESFTVRKISYGEGVERVFPLYAPMIDSIKLVRRGKVRRAKLYYLRGLRGKSARIAESQGRHGAGTHPGAAKARRSSFSALQHRTHLSWPSRSKNAVAFARLCPAMCVLRRSTFIAA